MYVYVYVLDINTESHKKCQCIKNDIGLLQLRALFFSTKGWQVDI